MINIHAIVKKKQNCCHVIIYNKLLPNILAIIMSVGPLSHVFGRQHLYHRSVNVTPFTILSNDTSVGPSVAMMLHSNGVVLLLHGSPLGNTHPPPLYGALCTHELERSEQLSQV